MRRVISSSLVPPGGWRFKVNDLTLKAGTFPALKSLVERHYSANGWDFDEIRWEEELCDQLNLGDTHCGEPPPPDLKGRVVGLHDLEQFAHTATEWFKAGGKCVPQEEADRRAEICSKCPENLNLTGCWACFAIIRGLTALFGKKTQYDKELRSCNVCGCTLKAKVHMPEEIMHATPQPRKPWPEWCWMKEG